MLFAFLDDAGTPPAELARRLGHSRQATGQLVEGLCRLGLLDLVDNPNRRGGRLVCYSQQGLQLRSAAYDILIDLESGLGARRVRTLRRLLAEFNTPVR
ncbi:helix-turn-helix domain-containing protein [Klenkia sp. PcliD-1-E]|uniref:MarR family transcriptional regulator n=1 Tax=Klenkia sp. PcliD-1-E TaxID=2954492 RepID=UPI0020985A44|nr:helix-turn-helix domain-containing protein [Klenkia sp. PcliD-1-E]MCO7218336.1 MarR family transcriptional regulator [Klenkia sp. PcliD-1-E]